MLYCSKSFKITIACLLLMYPIVNWALLGPMEKCSIHSPISLPSPSRNVLSSNCYLFLLIKKLIQYKIEGNISKLVFWCLYTFPLSHTGVYGQLKPLALYCFLLKKKKCIELSPATSLPLERKGQKTYWEGWEMEAGEIWNFGK